jgi:hypothetical protein
MTSASPHCLERLGDSTLTGELKSYYGYAADNRIVITWKILG